MFAGRICHIAADRRWLGAALVAGLLILAACGGGTDGTSNPTGSHPSMLNVTLNDSGNSAGNNVVLKAHGENLIDLAQQWPTWSGEDSGIRFEDGALLLPGDGSDLILGVNRFAQPLTGGATYSLQVDASSAGAAAVLFLFDINGALVPVPDSDGLAIARNGEPLVFAAPADVAGFYLQVQNQYQAVTETVLSASLIEGEPTDPLPAGDNLIGADGAWPDWSNTNTGVIGADGVVTIPAVSDGGGNVIGVRRFDTTLVAGGEYELAALRPSDAGTSVLLFLFGTSGATIPFAGTDASTNWLAASAAEPGRFVAPGGVSGFAVQVQGAYQATDAAIVVPSLRRIDEDPDHNGGGDTGDGDDNLISLDTDWNDWNGLSTGVQFDAALDALQIPAPAVDENPILGVHRFLTPLQAGTTYRLATGRDADYGTRVILYLFDQNGQSIPFDTDPDEETLTLSVTSDEPVSNTWFTAPDDVAGFVVQVQSPYFDSTHGAAPRNTQIAPTLKVVADDVIAPTTPDSVSFFAFGDQGSGDDKQQTVADAIELIAGNAPATGFSILLGDNFYENGVNSISDPQWDTKFESVYSGPILSQLPFFAVLGNHDRYDNFQAQIDYGNQRIGSARWKLPSKFYARDFGRVNHRPLLRVVFLDTTPGNELDEQQAQFVADAFSASNGNPVWKVVAGHHPVRNAGLQHGGNNDVANWLQPALIQAGVDLYLAGHEHNLQLLQAPGEPAYVISGGGGRFLHTRLDRANPNLRFGMATHGFSRVQADPAALQIEFYDERGVREHVVVVR